MYSLWKVKWALGIVRYLADTKENEMITKVDALVAVAMLDLFDTPDSVREEAKEKLHQFIEQQPASTSAQVPEALQTFEGYSAIRQAHEIVKSNEYFNARFDGLDTRDRRNVFLAGFNSGFDARHMLNQPAPTGNQPQEG